MELLSTTFGLDENAMPTTARITTNAISALRLFDMWFSVQSYDDNQEQHFILFLGLCILLLFVDVRNHIILVPCYIYK